MTVTELRALLETLPERFDDTEVMVYANRGLCHISRLELDRKRSKRHDWWPNSDEIPGRALERKLRIAARPATLWYEDAPEWRLQGWWPKEAAEIGLP